VGEDTEEKARLMPSEAVGLNRRKSSKPFVVNPLQGKNRTGSELNRAGVSVRRNFVQLLDDASVFPLSLAIDRGTRQKVSHRRRARGYLGMEC
jgi:hypothetical protein